MSVRTDRTSNGVRFLLRLDSGEGDFGIGSTGAVDRLRDGGGVIARRSRMPSDVARVDRVARVSSACNLGGDWTGGSGNGGTFEDFGSEKGVSHELIKDCLCVCAT